MRCMGVAGVNLTTVETATYRVYIIISYFAPYQRTTHVPRKRNANSILTASALV